MSKHFDLIVVGGGSAGYAAARTGRDFAENVAVVDGSDKLAGLCILRGCMPSKTLIYAAEVLHHARHGKQFGLNIPTAEADMAAVQARKQQIIGEFSGYRRDQLESDRFTLFRKHGKVTGPNEVTLSDGIAITGDRIFISTGSTINWPGVPGLREVDALTSDDILDLDWLPESIIVLGGGVVACELTQYLSRIGSKVTQIQRSSQILKDASSEAAAVVMEAFRAEGIDLYTGTSLKQVARTADGVSATFEHAGETKTVTAAHLFNALGRKPATEGLGLAEVGVDLRTSGHIVTNAFMQTAVPSIYAGGDCVGPHEIVHVAIKQAEIAGRHMFGKPTRAINYESLLGVTFTDPQVAFVGMDEDDLRQRDLDPIAFSMTFDDHGKSILMEAKRGFVKVIASRRDGRIYGAECVGKDAGELIHAMTYPVAVRAHVSDTLRADWYHPTLAEIWTYPLEDLHDAVGCL